MCGIVGVVGRGPAAAPILSALRRLGYRGYDSAGIATLERGLLARRRAVGKLKNLESKLTSEPLAGLIGIGHTRWATHGRPIKAIEGRALFDFPPMTPEGTSPLSCGLSIGKARPIREASIRNLHWSSRR
jgi:hypothetical protein